MPTGKRADGTFLANIPVDRAVWDKAKAKAKSEGRSLASVLREFLDEYVKP